MVSFIYDLVNFLIIWGHEQNVNQLVPISWGWNKWDEQGRDENKMSVWNKWDVVVCGGDHIGVYGKILTVYVILKWRIVVCSSISIRQ